MEKTLVVMAAGMGSRFGGLKQIEPVGPNGEFLIDYSVYDAKQAGFTKIVFIIKKELESAFRETIGKRLEDKIEVEYVFQEIDDIPEAKKYLAERRTKPWGTVQAVLVAKNATRGDFLVINADDFYGRDAYIQASKFIDDSKNDREYACISYPYQVTASKFGSVKRAVISLEGNSIKRLVESKIENKEGEAIAYPLDGSREFKIELNAPVSMNMFVFKNSFFGDLEEYFNDFFMMDDDKILASELVLADIIEEKLKSGEITLRNVTSSGMWIGMTYREDLDSVKINIDELVKKGEYPNNLWG